MKEHILEVRKLIPQEYCNKIIEYFSENLEDAKIGTRTEKIKTDKSTRNCKTKHLLNDENSFGKKLVLNYIKIRIFDAIQQYQELHPYLRVFKISQLDLLKYEKNEYPVGYEYHVDYSINTSLRAISMSICLNNYFDGGEFKFKLSDGEYQYHQNVGDCIIFPSNFMFPHQVNPISFGKRYSLVAWAI